jgi:hypothetical protein
MKGFVDAPEFDDALRQSSQVITDPLGAHDTGGRFYAQRAFGLPMANRSQHRTRSLSFMISTTYPPAPVQASGTSIQPTAAATPGSQPEPRVWKISAEAVSPQRA